MFSSGEGKDTWGAAMADGALRHVVTALSGACRGARPYEAHSTVTGVGARRAVPETALTRPDRIGTPSPWGRGVKVRGTWTLPTRGLAVFHGAGNVARLSHYFLPRLLMEGRRVLFLDGANCADPRLLERFARERHVPFERFNRGIQIARAFTCFQLTELIARVPKFLRDFPAEVVIVTAFPDLYFDEDVRDWNARVAFERGLRNLRRWAGRFHSEGRGFSPAGIPLTRPLATLSPSWGRGAGGGGEGLTAAGLKLRPPGVAIAVFSAIQDFAPPPTRQRFFPRLCAAANEIWRFSVDAENRLKLIGEHGQSPPGPVRRLADRTG